MKITLILVLLFASGCGTIRSTHHVLRAVADDIENITDAAVQGRGAYDARYNARYNAPQIVD